VGGFGNWSIAGTMGWVGSVSWWIGSGWVKKSDPCPSLVYTPNSMSIGSSVFAALDKDELVAWHSGGTSVSDWRTFPVLRPTCS